MSEQDELHDSCQRTNGRWFQFSVRTLGIQVLLAGLSLTILLSVGRGPDNDWWMLETVILLSLTGAIVGGMLCNFRMGALIGVVHSLVVWAMFYIIVNS